MRREKGGSIPIFSLFLYCFVNKLTRFLKKFVSFKAQTLVFLTYFCQKNEINLVFLKKIIIIDNEYL